MTFFYGFSVGFQRALHITLTTSHLTCFLEKHMTKRPAISGMPIPMGILVSVSGKVRQAERPTVKRKAAPDEQARPLPWAWIVSGGGVAWALMIMILAIGWCRHAPSRVQPQPNQPQTVVPSIVAAAPMARAKPKHIPKVVEPVEELAIIVPGPKLLMRERRVEKIDELPPPLLLDRAPAEVVQAAAVELRTPDVATAQPQPPGQEMDRNVFANAERIGSEIRFMKDPVEAFKRAKIEQKLVFIMHLSGNLEDQEFT